MDPTSLTLLVHIVDAGSLAQAARQLKMTRANVSYRLARLEKQVGVQLIRRTTLQAEPTEVGKRLYEHGRIVLNELVLAQETVATLGKDLHGRVGISVPSGFGQMVMTDWLIEFKQRYPDVVLDVTFENRVDKLVRDEIDIAIRILPEPPPALVARDMGPVRYIACASKAYALAQGMPTELEQLAHTPVVTSGVVGHRLRLRGYEGETYHETLLDPTIISEHFPFLRQCILAGLGIGVVPDYVVRNEIASGDVITTLERYRLSIFGTHMYMLYMPNRNQTKAIRTCIDFLLERAGQTRPRT